MFMYLTFLVDFRLLRVGTTLFTSSFLVPSCVWQKVSVYWMLLLVKLIEQGHNILPSSFHLGHCSLKMQPSLRCVSVLGVEALYSVFLWMGPLAWHPTLGQVRINASHLSQSQHDNSLHLGGWYFVFFHYYIWTPLYVFPSLMCSPVQDHSIWEPQDTQEFPLLPAAPPLLDQKEIGQASTKVKILQQHFSATQPPLY